MDRKRGLLAGAAVVVVLAAVVGFSVWRSGDDGDRDPARPGVDTEDPAVVAADAFAAAWEAGTLADAPLATGSGDVAGLVAVLTADLTSADTDRPTVTVTRVVHADPTTSSTATSAAPASSSVEPDGSAVPTIAVPTDRSTATATVTWRLDGGRSWRYDTSIPLVEEAGEWRVAFTPSVVEPSLQTGEVLRSVRVPGTRGRVLDTEGTALVGAKGSVVVGIRKSRTTDPEGTARTVAALTGVDAEELVASVAAAGPDDFVEVTTLPRADYDRIRAQIQPLPGTVFREEVVASDLPVGFARALLGTTGTATPEIAEASEGRVLPGDLTGLTGLQLAQDEVLAGTPGLRVEAVGPAGTAPRVLQDFPAEPGRDVTITIDRRVQEAADAVMATAPKPAALVALQISTGDVLAVANGPANASGYNRALIGRYPPGSTFKVASTLALFEQGLTPEEEVACPARIVVGKEFRNAGGFVLGRVPFSTAFARSCNTAFVGQADRVSSGQLAEVAARLGLREHQLGVPTFGGSVPVTDDRTEHAADLIGQGKVEASPLTIALMSASVANGTSLQPRLLVDPAQGASGPGEPLPAGAVASLRDLMRSVVTDGTGSALAGVPGGEVRAKTGTAEFGADTPPRSHAWITGYQGDVAFAVLVEDGGGGGAVAGPLAADFLTRLAG